jgi:hypothetical protein
MGRFPSASVAESRAAFGDLATARETAAALRKQIAHADQPVYAASYNRALAEIAAAQVRAGDDPAALKTADEFLETRQDKSGKTDILKRIALEQARCKDWKAAKATAALLPPGGPRLAQLLQIAEIQTKSDERGATATYREVLAAVAKVKSEPDLLQLGLHRLAEALGERGEAEAVLRWLQTQKSADVQTLTLLGLARGVAKRQEKKE